MQERKIKYTRLPPVGTDKLEVVGGLGDLVQHIPSLIYLRTIPPLHVLNEVLKTGYQDAGMSGGAEWEPFEVTPKEHAALVQDLESHPQIEYRFLVPPPEIASFDDWWQWVLKQKKETHRSIPKPVKSFESE